MTLLIPPSFQPETETDARTRYAVIASAIASEAGTDARLARFMITVAKHESSFARNVHAGERRGDGGRSWGLFQIMCGRHPTGIVPGTSYRARDIVGIDTAATQRAASAVAFHLRKGIKACSGAPMCVFKRYGGVSQTVTPKQRKRLEARVATYWRLVGTR